MQCLKAIALAFYCVHVCAVGILIFAKSRTTAQPQAARKFSDQGYENKRLKFQVSLPSILGPSMEPDSLSFPALITKPQSHLALSGYLVFCKIPMRSMYVHEQYRSKVR